MPLNAACPACGLAAARSHRAVGATTADVAKVGIRLFAVIMLVEPAVVLVFAVVGWLMVEAGLLESVYEDDRMIRLLIVVRTLGSLLLYSGLWVLSGAVSRRIASGRSDWLISPGLTTHGVMRTGVVLLALYLIATALVDLVRSMFFIDTTDPGSPRYDFMLPPAQDLTLAALTVALGVLLLHRPVLDWLTRRFAEDQPPPPTNAAQPTA